MTIRPVLACACVSWLAGCGALPNDCPNEEISREAALHKAVLAATAGRIPRLQQSEIDLFLASQPRDCCIVEVPQQSWGERIFEQPRAQTRYRVVLNLKLKDGSLQINKYADMKINPCGRIIEYSGDTQKDS